MKILNQTDNVSPRNILRLNSTNILSGADNDGWYTVHAGRKGQSYRILPANPPEPEEITALRESLGMKKGEFAEALGVSAAAVSAWENGKKRPDGIASRLLDMIRMDGSLIRRDERQAGA